MEGHHGGPVKEENQAWMWTGAVREGRASKNLGQSESQSQEVGGMDPGSVFGTVCVEEG